MNFFKMYQELNQTPVPQQPMLQPTPGAGVSPPANDPALVAVNQAINGIKDPNLKKKYLDAIAQLNQQPMQKPINQPPQPQSQPQSQQQTQLPTQAAIAQQQLSHS